MTADDPVQSHTFGLNSKALLSATLTSSFSLWTALSNWIPSWCFSHSRGLRWPVRPLLTRPLTLCPSSVCNNSMIPTEIKWDIADMDTCSPSVPSFLLSFTLGLFLNNDASVVTSCHTITNLSIPLSLIPPHLSLFQPLACFLPVPPQLSHILSVTTHLRLTCPRFLLHFQECHQSNTRMSPLSLDALQSTGF